MSQSYIRFSGVENSFMYYPLRMEELDMDIVDLQKAFNDFSEAYQEVNEGQGIPFFPYGYRFSACLCKFLF